jgi:hypothetical protein
MKRNSKKLTLNRETVRKLSAEDLARAHGAIDGTPPSRTCITCVTCWGCTGTCLTVCFSQNFSDCCLASDAGFCIG